MKNVANLKKATEKARQKNEYRCSTIKGVKNLTRSDLDEADLYAELIEEGNTRGYMAPRGNVAELLTAFGLTWEKKEGFYAI